MSIRHVSKTPFTEVNDAAISYDEFCEMERLKVLVNIEANDIALARLLLDKAKAEGEEGKLAWIEEDKIMFDGALARIAVNRLEEVEIPDAAPVVNEAESATEEGASTETDPTP